MSRETALAAGRARAEEAFTDTIRWERLDATTPMTQDETTGAMTRDYTPLFTTKAKVRIGAIGTLVPTARETTPAGTEVTQLRSVVHIPFDAPPLQPNDIGVVTAVGEMSDFQLLGKRLRVVAPIGQSYATARRFSVEEVLQ